MMSQTYYRCMLTGRDLPRDQVLVRKRTDGGPDHELIIVDASLPGARRAAAYYLSLDSDYVDGGYLPRRGNSRWVYRSDYPSVEAWLEAVDGGAS